MSELTDASVKAVLKRTRGLCRAYLQFGPEAMSAEDLAKLTTIVNARTGTNRNP